MRLSNIALSLTAMNGSSSFARGSSLALDFLSGNNTLDPRVTFSRTTNATLTNSAGLVANAPMNLLTFSEQFDNAAWLLDNATVSANQTAAPDGATTADKLVEAATTSPHQFTRNPASGSLSFTAGVTYAYSFYVKAAGRTQLNIQADTGASTFPASANASYDFSGAGVVVSQGASATASISSVGNGWFRCVFVATATATVSSRPGYYVGLAVSGSASYTGNGTSGIFIWGAQLELGSTATTYNPTTVKNLLGFTENFDNAAWTKSNSFVQTNLLTYSQDFDNAAWAKSNATVTANGDTAPNGSTTADKLVEDTATSTHSVVFPSLTKAATSLQYTFSVYVKASERSAIQMRIADASSSANRVNCDANLSAQTVTTSVGGTFSSPSAAITSVGNGWLRVSLTGTTSTETSLALLVFLANPAGTINYTGAAGSGVFIWGAQVVQGTSAGDYKATYAAAAAVGYTDIYGQPFAQKLVENTANSSHVVLSTSFPTTTSGTIYTFSTYAKAAERTLMYLRDNATSNVGAYFDLVTGTAYSPEAGVISTNVTNMGNGWYRCSVTYASTATSANTGIRTVLTGTTISYTGDGTSGIYIFGAQLSDSASVDPYVYQPVAAPSSVAYYGPRFDYDPVTLAPKGLLIEEQRTNLVLQSDGGTGWGVNGTATVTSDTGTAPNGTNTAFTLTNATDVVLGSNNVFKTFSVSASTAITMSLYVKAITATTVSINIFDGATGSSSSQSIALTSGWQRVQVTRTSGAATTAMRFTIGAANGTVLCWGAQAEAGAFATSYIPTVASQVTRTADSASMIGNNFARWYNVNEGTVYAQADVSVPSAVNAAVFSLGSTTSDIMRIFRQTDAQPVAQVITGGAAQATMGLGASWTTTAAQKIAFAYATNNFSATTNGGTTITDTSGTVPIVSQAVLGNAAGIGALNGHLARVAFYSRVLSSAEQKGITS